MSERQATVFDIPKDVVRRLGALTRGLVAERECVVASGNFSRQPARDCATRICRAVDVEAAVDALSEFIERLFDIPGVEGTAFLSVSEANCPTTLSIEMFAPLRPGDGIAIETVDAVTTANAALAYRLSGFLPSGLRFVNTSHTGLHRLKHRARRRWDSDPTLDLLRLVVFRRE